MVYWNVVHLYEFNLYSDPDLVKFGVTAKVLKVLDDNGFSYELYSNIKPNPTIENVSM